MVQSARPEVEHLPGWPLERNNAGELNIEGSPKARDVPPANSSLAATADSQVYPMPDVNYLHDHTMGIVDYYFLTGDETVKEALNVRKAYYLNTDTYQHTLGLGDPWGYARTMGIMIGNASRLSEYLSAI